MTICMRLAFNKPINSLLLELLIRAIQGGRPAQLRLEHNPAHPRGVRVVEARREVLTGRIQSPALDSSSILMVYFCQHFFIICDTAFA